VTLTGAPACTVATRVAGLADFRAVLEWDEPLSSPPSCLPTTDGSFRHELRETPSPCGTRLEVRGAVRALTPDTLGAALERVMRLTADAAAVTGAVLEMRVLREERPKGSRPDVVEALAMDLWRAGFGVRFAPCWEPVGPDGISLGVWGEEDSLREFLSDHPAWKPA
jgi:hypothetical protein